MQFSTITYRTQRPYYYVITRSHNLYDIIEWPSIPLLFLTLWSTWKKEQSAYLVQHWFKVIQFVNKYTNLLILITRRSFYRDRDKNPWTKNAFYRTICIPLALTMHNSVVAFNVRLSCAGMLKYFVAKKTTRIYMLCDFQRSFLIQDMQCAQNAS